MNDTTENRPAPAAPRRAIVSGASIAGLSTAYWLRRTGWEVHVVERAPAFRDGGQNIDVRGVAREVVRRMGLFEEIAARNTTETGTDLVDAHGRVTATLPDGGGQGATAELEVLRGDLARVLLDHLPEGVAFTYGDAIASVRDDGAQVTATLESGRVLTADLLVVAEGVRSATRDRMFGDVVDRRDLDVTMVYGTIPRQPDDDDRWRWHTAAGGRQVHLRPDNRGTIRAILACSPGEDLHRRSRPDALAVLRRRFEGTGWKTERILDGFARATGADDVYVDDLAQIRAETWHRGRTVLTGDAAWCVTPLGGGGASLALTGGYVLAAALQDHDADLDAALTAYEEWLRPLVAEVQDIPTALLRFAYPRSRLAVGVRGLLDKALTSAPLRPVALRFTQVAETDQELPDLVADAA